MNKNCGRRLSFSKPIPTLTDRKHRSKKSSLKSKAETGTIVVLVSALAL
jgi:hypothetical protein